MNGLLHDILHVSMREEGSGWETHVYLWRIHFDIWQNQYNIVKFKNKIKFKKINKNNTVKKKKESITTNKASGGDGIPVGLFQILHEGGSLKCLLD